MTENPASAPASTGAGPHSAPAASGADDQHTHEKENDMTEDAQTTTQVEVWPQAGQIWVDPETAAAIRVERRGGAVDKQVFYDERRSHLGWWESQGHRPVADFVEDFVYAAENWDEFVRKYGTDAAESGNLSEGERARHEAVRQVLEVWDELADDEYFDDFLDDVRDRTDRALREKSGSDRLSAEDEKFTSAFTLGVRQAYTEIAAALDVHPGYLVRRVSWSGVAPAVEKEAD